MHCHLSSDNSTVMMIRKYKMHGEEGEGQRGGGEGDGMGWVGVGVGEWDGRGGRGGRRRGGR